MKIKVKGGKVVHERGGDFEISKEDIQGRITRLTERLATAQERVVAATAKRDKVQTRLDVLVAVEPSARAKADMP